MQPRESEMPIVVQDPRKGKSVVSDGALTKIMFSEGITRQNRRTIIKKESEPTGNTSCVADAEAR